MPAANPAEYLQDHVSALLPYTPCKWYGCEDEVYYRNGPGAGMCREHGLHKMRRNLAGDGTQARATRAKRAEALEKRAARASAAGVVPLEPLAKRVLDATRAVDRASLASREAEAKRQEALLVWKDAVTQLIKAAQAG